MTRPLVVGLILSAVVPAGGAAQTATILGAVRDSATGDPLPGVRIEFTAGAHQRIQPADEAGRFRFERVPAGPYTLRATRIGYRPATAGGATRSDDTVRVELRLAAFGIPLDPVVVSASRAPETALDAPAAVSVVSREAIEEAVTLAPVELIRNAPGVDMATKGLIQRTFSVRGDLTSNSGSLLLLTDYRYAALPSVSFNIPYLIAAGAEDLDRMELVRGPASALYGPGAPRGVLHLVTRSPFESRGGAVALIAGSRSSIGGDFRVAERLSQRFAIKLSGSYLQGDDWPSSDAQEEAQRADAIAAGADPDTLRIGLRDFNLGRASGEARLDWRPDDRTEVVTTIGAAQALRAVDMTPFGGIQGQDWRYSFGQIRLRRDRLSANVFYNWSDAGDSYVLRTGDPLVDDSRVLVGQVQHGATMGPVDLLYGADLRWTDPRTGGTISGANEDSDRTTELGGYAHATWAVSPRLQAIGALRVDHHTALNDLAVSPRVALVFKPAPTQALRASYNRAFTSPDANDLFLDIVADEIALPGGFGYAIRGTGVPKDGFHFRRDCRGGLCMRTPFAIAIGVPSNQYLPADATVLWPAVVAYAQSQGIDLSGIPAPDASQVGTRIARLDIGAATPAFVDVDPSAVTDVEGEGRTITNAIELGYKGFFANRVALTTDLWMARVSDVAGSQYVATPSVFYDEGTLRSYLAGFMTPEEAAQLAGIIAQIPAGTISPEETPHPTDLLAVSPRGGAYTLWGADLGLDVAISRALTVGGTYSWVSADTIPNVQVLGVVYLNAPRDKASLKVEYRNDAVGITASARGRYVRSFPVANGVYVGYVDAYALVDLAVGLAIPGWRAATLSLSVQNVFDERHVEFVGAPELGRYVLTRLRVGW
ncbi:MAG: TonB-dependent receptor [Gemmatimonadota bacterium]|nr:TonB-dependent receptor [Gemmatimonadota bacterium]